MAHVDDPIWQTHAPSNGHNCRCTLVSLTEQQAKARGYDGNSELPEYTDRHGIKQAAQPDKGWSHSPENNDLTALLREREKKHALKPAKMPEAEAIKTVSFAHLSANPQEVERLIKEGARKDEAILADKWQQYFGDRLVGYQLGTHKQLVPDKPADFAVMDSTIPTKDWITLDVMYTLGDKASIEAFNKNLIGSPVRWEKAKTQIINHTRKADVVPIDITNLNIEALNKLREFMLLLPVEIREKIILIRGGNDNGK